MEKTHCKINKKTESCICWDINEFNKEFNPKNWKREWNERGFLSKIKITAPNECTNVAGSGLSIEPTEKTENKEIYGVDVFRKDDHGDTKISVYHYPFYKKGNKIVMPTKPHKRKGEHHIKTISEFQEKHDESTNYKR